MISTNWELVAYLGGAIRTRQDTPVLKNLTGSFQGHLAIAALWRAFPGHYLNASTMTPSPTGADPFKLMRTSPSSLHPTISRLQGGAGNAESGSDNDSDNTYNLRLNVCINAAVADPPLPRPSASPAPGVAGGGGPDPQKNQHQY